jgi:hypothetical protein
MKKVIIFVHEESNKIVSKVCGGCGETRLVEDYVRTQNKLEYASLCVDCREAEKKGA